MTTPRQSESMLIELMDRYPAMHELIAAARQTLITAFPGIAEEPDVKAGLIGYNYGPGYKGVVATLILSKNGVKIGIPYGAAMKDPSHLLEGKGKVHRHIAITTVASLNRPALKQLLAETLQAWQLRAGS